MIDAYDDAVRGFRETGRSNPQLYLFTAEQLRKLFQPAKEDVKTKLVIRFAKDAPGEVVELKQGWDSWTE